MSIKLSHTKKDKINTCGMLYKLHYIDRIRPNELGSALFFGSALDEAFGRLLLDKKVYLTNEEKELLSLTSAEVFSKHMRTCFYNNELLQLEDTEKTSYFKSDCDLELLDSDDMAKIIEYDDEVDDIELFVENYHEMIKKKKTPDLKDRKLYNYICWHSLYKKGLMMLEQYEKEVLPQISKVFSIQERIHLPNDDGDEITGLIDFTCEFVDEPGVVYIVDNKTSSKAYSESSVQDSEQLTTYAEYANNYNAAFIVVNKRLRKKDPRVRIQIIRDKIDDESADVVFEQYENALQKVRKEEFEKNYESGCFFFGRKCAYYNYCRHGSMKGLIDLKKESE